jgi:hypothetical protein
MAYVHACVAAQRPSHVGVAPIIQCIPGVDKHYSDRRDRAQNLD